jgi:hypothetical protein
MALYSDKFNARETCDFKTRDELIAGIGVGSEVLTFDQNRTVYAPGTTGHPIPRGYFRVSKVVGETSRSWILGWEGGPKIGKKKLDGVYSDRCADRYTWLRENYWKVSQAFERAVREDSGFDLAVEMAERLGLELPAIDA